MLALLGHYLNSLVKGIVGGQETTQFGELTAAQIAAWLAGIELKGDMVDIAVKFLVKAIAAPASVLGSAWDTTRGALRITNDLWVRDGGTQDTITLNSGATSGTHQPAAGDIIELQAVEVTETATDGDEVYTFQNTEGTSPANMVNVTAANATTLLAFADLGAVPVAVLKHTKFDNSNFLRVVSTNLGAGDSIVILTHYEQLKT